MDVGHEREDITQSHSQETLRRVKENDESLKTLWIGGTVHIAMGDQGNEVVTVRVHVVTLELGDDAGVFNPSNDSEFSSLGEYVAENTHLKELVHVGGRVGLDAECLRHHSSIHKLKLICGGHDISEGAVYDIFQVYQEKGNLTSLYIDHAILQNGGDNVLVNTLRSCANLQRIILCRCDINGEQMLAIVEAIRGHNMLEELHLFGNSIDNVGCGALATLLDNPNCNLRHLSLLCNNIDNEGAITIVNSLTNNTGLQKLDLRNNPINYQSVIEESFSKVLCNTSSISNVYSSNHTLKMLEPHYVGGLLSSQLKLNRGGASKTAIAMKKILKHYPDMDMEPMFEWDAEEGEQNLKALPYVVDWFERAESAFQYDWSNYDKKEERFIVEKRKLDAINQFARAMPLLFEGVSAM